MCVSEGIKVEGIDVWHFSWPGLSTQLSEFLSFSYFINYNNKTTTWDDPRVNSTLINAPPPYHHHEPSDIITMQVYWRSIQYIHEKNVCMRGDLWFNTLKNSYQEHCYFSITNLMKQVFSNSPYLVFVCRDRLLTLTGINWWSLSFFSGFDNALWNVMLSVPTFLLLSFLFIVEFVFIVVLRMLAYFVVGRCFLCSLYQMQII